MESQFPSPMDPIIRSFARPIFARASAGPSSAPHPALPAHSMGQKFDEQMELPGWLGDVIRLLGHGGMGLVGIHSGTKNSGFWGTLAWIVGIMSSFAALLDVCSLIGRLRPAAPPPPPNPIPSPAPEVLL